jgi:hypothetical protein
MFRLTPTIPCKSKNASCGSLCMTISPSNRACKTERQFAFEERGDAKNATPLSSMHFGDAAWGSTPWPYLPVNAVACSIPSHCCLGASCRGRCLCCRARWPQWDSMCSRRRSRPWATPMRCARQGRCPCRWVSRASCRARGRHQPEDAGQDGYRCRYHSPTTTLHCLNALPCWKLLQ